MKNVLKNSILILIVVLATACSEYNQILKGSDYQKKYEAAVKYYEEEDYFKSSTLLEELLTVYRGTKKAEEIYYYYAFSQYGLMDFDFAAFHFKNFVKNFSHSEKVEEVSFMIALCYFRSSAKSSLDQKYTLKALQEFQYFLDKYPNTERKQEVNEKVDILRGKLEKKAFDLAYLYFKTGYYKSAIIAFENVLKDYPDIDRVDEVYYYIVKSNYMLATLSVESKMKKRFEATKEAAKNFLRRYPNHKKYRKEVENILEDSKKKTKKEKNNINI